MRRLFVILGLLLVASGVLNVALAHWEFATDQPPVDFELNWVAAHRLLDREPLYDRVASKQDGLELIGSEFEFSNGGTYASFIGSPATALVYAPFTPFDRATAADLYRALQLVLMLTAIVIVGFALPRRSRFPAWLFGFGAFLWSYPVAESIGLGQVDGFIMVALAIAIWASVRDRWRLVGVALGIAALLKISPALLILYLVLRGRRQVIVPAITSAGALLAAAVVVGRPGDVVKWFTDVLPEVSKGGLLINNQSVPAWLARLFGSNTDWLSLDAGIGAWRYLAPLIAISGVLALWWARRGHAYAPLELGIVILITLLAGPISWDHYPTWALLTVVLMTDLVWWEHRERIESTILVVVAALGTALLRKYTQYPTSEIVRGDWTRRVESGTKTMGMLAYLAVAGWLLMRPPEGGDGKADRRLDGDESGSEGVHARG